MFKSYQNMLSHPQNRPSEWIDVQTVSAQNSEESQVTPQVTSQANTQVTLKVIDGFPSDEEDAEGRNTYPKEDKETNTELNESVMPCNISPEIKHLLQVFKGLFLIFSENLWNCI